LKVLATFTEQAGAVSLVKQITDSEFLLFQRISSWQGVLRIKDNE
jgi:hypothetical protein